MWLTFMLLNFQVKYHQCLAPGGKMYCNPGMVDKANRFPQALHMLHICPMATEMIGRLMKLMVQPWTLSSRTGGNLSWCKYDGSLHT